jgi:stearoyl-CoA desaturase (delta-9 desaturase)
VLLHLACLAVFLPGIHLTWTALTLLIVFYALRVFGLTAGYHRYFAHRAFKTGRAGQFVLALLGCSALQRGPLWWAGHHRHHHRFSDTEEDVHSPIIDSFWYSHVGWVFDQRNDGPQDSMHDFAKYPELRLLEKYHWTPGILVAVVCFLIGGWSGLVWGFFVSTVAVYHVTFMVNSLCHVWGKRKYPTTDYSKNNPWIALLTFGEGWHNNHHHYQSSANQGFFWWEIDISYMALKVLRWLGLVWDLRTPPAAKRVRSKLPIPAPPKVAQALGLARERDRRVTAAFMQSPAAPEPGAYAAPVLAAAHAVAAPVLAAAHLAQERVSAAAHAAGESLRAAAQAAQEKVTAVAQSASDSMKLAAQAATPVVVSAAGVAVPAALVVTTVSQST